MNKIFEKKKIQDEQSEEYLKYCQDYAKWNTYWTDKGYGIEETETQFEAVKIPYDFSAEVQNKIRKKYSLTDELGIQRMRDESPGEFQEYNEYVKQCINEAGLESKKKGD